MKLSRSTKLILLGLLISVSVFILIFMVIRKIGTGFQGEYNNKDIEELNQQLRQDQDISYIKLETRDGKVVEIFQNGSLTRTEDGNTENGVLGYSKLNQFLSSLTEDQIRDLYNNQTPTDNPSYTITFTTKSGNTYIIEISEDDDEVPDEIVDLIDEIEETEEETLDPTPYPTFIPTPTPTPTGPTLTPTPTLFPTPTPTPPLFPTPTPSPGPTPLPGYMTAEPFACSDYNLVKNTVISNIICTPNP